MKQQDYYNKVPYEPDEADIAMLSDDKKSVLWAQVGADIEELWVAVRELAELANEVPWLQEHHSMNLMRIEDLEERLDKIVMVYTKIAERVESNNCWIHEGGKQIPLMLERLDHLEQVCAQCIAEHQGRSQ